MLFVAFPVCTGSNRPLLLIIVYPNEGGVAGYGNRTKVKYTAKWGLQIAEMIFQTRSSNPKAPKSMIFCPLVSLYCIWIVSHHTEVSHLPVYVNEAAVFLIPADL